MKRVLLLILNEFAIAAIGVGHGVHRLPITRTTIDDWSFLAKNSRDMNPNPKSQSQYPLAERVRRRSSSPRKHATRDRKHLSTAIFPSPPGIDFWSMYTAPISLGNPPLNLDALIDTSWSPFFAPSVNCTYDYPYHNNPCLRHALYNSSLSTTYHADLSPVRMIYWGMQGVDTYGKISNDSLHIAGMQITNQVFNEATKWEPGDFTSDEEFDTVLGLALYPTYDRKGNFSAPGPFQNMVKEGLLKESLFSLALPRFSDNERGEIIFGGLPDNVTREDLVEVPLNYTRGGQGTIAWDFYSSNGWQISVAGLDVAWPISSESVPVLTKDYIAVISNSWPYISLPPNASEQVNKFIGFDYRRAYVDCAIRFTLPDLVFDFGVGKSVRLTAWDYLYETYDYEYRERKCHSTFTPVDEEDEEESGMILLGAPFLQGLHSVFDADRKSISFANRKDEEVMFGGERS